MESLQMYLNFFVFQITSRPAVKRVVIGMALVAFCGCANQYQQPMQAEGQADLDFGKVLPKNFSIFGDVNCTKNEMYGVVHPADGTTVVRLEPNTRHYVRMNILIDASTKTEIINQIVTIHTSRVYCRQVVSFVPLSNGKYKLNAKAQPASSVGKSPAACALSIVDTLRDTTVASLAFHPLGSACGGKNHLRNANVALDKGYFLAAYNLFSEAYMTETNEVCDQILDKVRADPRLLAAAQESVEISAKNIKNRIKDQRLFAATLLERPEAVTFFALRGLSASEQFDEAVRLFDST